MKFSFMFLLALMFIVSCGNNDDDNNRFINGVNAFGQQCSLNTVNGFNNLNNFYNNNPYGYSNPYQLELARRCGYALNTGFNNGFNNGINNGNNGCFVARDMQNISGVNNISRQTIVNLSAEFESELNDVHGIQQPVAGEEEHYYTQVGFYAGVNTGGGFGGGYPYGPYNPQFGYGYCDMLAR